MTVTQLCDRDRQIGEMLSAGKTYKEIARDMNITEGELRFWIRRLRLFFKCKNSVELACLLIRNGLIA